MYIITESFFRPIKMIRLNSDADLKDAPDSLDIFFAWLQLVDKIVYV